MQKCFDTRKESFVLFFQYFCGFVNPIPLRPSQRKIFMTFELMQLSTSYLLTSLKIFQRIWQHKSFKGELQRENKLISYERAFKMLESDMYIVGIGQAVLELLRFKVESGNHQRGLSLLQKFSYIFGNMRIVPLKMTSHLTSHIFQILKIEIFSKLCKI